MTAMIDARRSPRFRAAAAPVAAQLGDKAVAIRAYRYYLRMRIDPEPSRMPQRDSVRAELTKIGDLEGTR